MNSKLISHLKSLATEERVQKLEKVVKDRTRYLSVVLEDIYQPQNASAVLRSCDCFGIQDVHVIENRNEFIVHRDIAMGSSKWLDVNTYNQEENNTLTTINKLKADGYRIIATTPHTNDVDLDELDLSKGKCALVFGTELTGVSDIVMENADEFMKVPMYGFTESFNISVCASIIAHHLTHKLQKSDIDWRLSQEDQDDVMLEWLKRSIKTSDKIIEAFHKKEIEKDKDVE